MAESPNDRLGVLICGHGSRNRLAVEEFAQMVEALRPKLAPMPVEHGYLEFARPILRDGLESLRQQGVTRVLAIPAMLFAAGHAKNDIPSVLNTFTAETGLPIDYGRELGVDRLMDAAAGARVRECLESAPSQVPLAEITAALASAEGKRVQREEWNDVFVGGGARTLEVSPDGRWLFVAVNGAAEVAVVDAQSMTVVSRIRADSYTVGLAVSPDGRQVWTTSQGKRGKGGNSVCVYRVTVAE